MKNKTGQKVESVTDKEHDAPTHPRACALEALISYEAIKQNSMQKQTKTMRLEAKGNDRHKSV